MGFRPRTSDLNILLGWAKKTSSVMQDFSVFNSLEVWPRCHQRETQHRTEEEE